MKTKKDKQNEIAEKAVAHAKTIKEVAEQNMRDKLYEAFSPQLKKMISQSILEMDDDEEDMDMDDMEMDEMGDYEDEDYMDEEGEGSDAEADELDPEDLEDLEKALDEEGEDYDDDGHEEVPTDVADELPDEEEDLEEASDDYDDMEDDSPEDFMAELQALIDEVDAEELNESDSVDESDSMDESEDGGSYTEKDKGDGGNTKKYESEDGGSYTEKDKGDGGNTKKYEGEDEDDDVDALREENQKLKATISEINKQLQETVLDEYKTNKFTKLVKEHNITETAKLKLMRAIDSGESEKEVNRIAEVFERTLPKRKKSKKSIKESKGGRNSSVRKPLSKKKNLKENKQAGNSGYDFDRWAELADIS